jgi:hypothetical protein
MALVDILLESHTHTYCCCVALLLFSHFLAGGNRSTAPLVSVVVVVVCPSVWRRSAYKDTRTFIETDFVLKFVCKSQKMFGERNNIKEGIEKIVGLDARERKSQRHRNDPTSVVCVCWHRAVCAAE